MVFITGGSSGIGRATAMHFALKSWQVGLIARGLAGLEDAAAAVRATGAQAEISAADVSRQEELQAAADRLAQSLGPPDIWINCAGNGVYGRFADVPEAEFDRVTAVTYGGTVNGCRVALALMSPRRRGTIVNVCSAAAFHGLPLMTSYAGAKAAVRCFTQALRAELRIARSPVRISAVFPPAVNTPFFSHAVSHMGWPARPAPPVYQPEVVAAGVYLAAMRATPEQMVSFTVIAFSLVNKIAPELIAWTMTRLGFEGQLTRDPGAARLEAPTLFEPSDMPSPVRGPFGRGARQFSVQLWLASLGQLVRRGSGPNRRPDRAMPAERVPSPRSAPR